VHSPPLTTTLRTCNRCNCLKLRYQSQPVMFRSEH
ncbi:hypothetical protein A2U01_0064633, partial [Trifolium medium]|nr:hypothetical protein [Trifolium medium]